MAQQQTTGSAQVNPPTGLFSLDAPFPVLKSHQRRRQRPHRHWRRQQHRTHTALSDWSAAQESSNQVRRCERAEVEVARCSADLATAAAADTCCKVAASLDTMSKLQDDCQVEYEDDATPSERPTGKAGSVGAEKRLANESTALNRILTSVQTTKTTTLTSSLIASHKSHTRPAAANNKSKSTAKCNCVHHRKVRRVKAKEEDCKRLSKKRCSFLASSAMFVLANYFFISASRRKSYALAASAQDRPETASLFPAEDDQFQAEAEAEDEDLIAGKSGISTASASQAQTPASSVYESFYGTLVNLGSFDMILVVLLITLILVSIIGNCLVCVAIFTDRRLRKLGNAFIVSLAIADLFVSCLVMTFALCNDLMNHWIFGEWFCDVWISFDIMCCTASILNLCAISLDRFIHIKDCMFYNQWMTRRIAISAVIMIWFISALVSFVPINLGWHKPSNLPAPSGGFDAKQQVYSSSSASSSSYSMPSNLSLVQVRLAQTSGLNAKRADKRRQKEAEGAQNEEHAGETSVEERFKRRASYEEDSLDNFDVDVDFDEENSNGSPGLAPFSTKTTTTTKKPSAKQEADFLKEKSKSKEAKKQVTAVGAVNEATGSGSEHINGVDPTDEDESLAERDYLWLRDNSKQQKRQLHPPSSLSGSNSNSNNNNKQRRALAAPESKLSYGRAYGSARLDPSRRNSDFWAPIENQLTQVSSSSDRASFSSDSKQLGAGNGSSLGSSSIESQSHRVQRLDRRDETVPVSQSELREAKLSGSVLQMEQCNGCSKLGPDLVSRTQTAGNAVIGSLAASNGTEQQDWPARRARRRPRSKIQFNQVESDLRTWSRRGLRAHEGGVRRESDAHDSYKGGGGVGGNNNNTFNGVALSSSSIEAGAEKELPTRRGEQLSDKKPVHSVRAGSDSSADFDSDSDSSSSSGELARRKRQALPADMSRDEAAAAAAAAANEQRPLPQCMLTLTPPYAVISSTISFYIPCIIMLGLYSKLFVCARKHVRNIQAISKLMQPMQVNAAAAFAQSATTTTPIAAAAASIAATAIGGGGAGNKNNNNSDETGAMNQPQPPIDAPSGLLKARTWRIKFRRRRMDGAASSEQRVDELARSQPAAAGLAVAGGAIECDTSEISAASPLSNVGGSLDPMKSQHEPTPLATTNVPQVSPGASRRCEPPNEHEPFLKKRAWRSASKHKPAPSSNADCVSLRSIASFRFGLSKPAHQQSTGSTHLLHINNIAKFATGSQQTPTMQQQQQQQQQQSGQLATHKAAITLGIIMGTFLFCWVPFFCLNIIKAFCVDCIPSSLFRAFTWLGYANSALNPIIYGIHNSEFRHAFNRIFFRHLRIKNGRKYLNRRFSYDLRSNRCANNNNNNNNNGNGNQQQQRSNSQRCVPNATNNQLNLQAGSFYRALSNNDNSTAGRNYNNNDHTCVHESNAQVRLVKSDVNLKTAGDDGNKDSAPANKGPLQSVDSNNNNNNNSDKIHSDTLSQAQPVDRNRSGVGNEADDALRVRSQEAAQTQAQTTCSTSNKQTTPVQHSAK